MNGCLGYSTERPGRVPGSTGPREWNLGEEGGGSETRVICGGDSWCRKGEPPAFLPGDGGRKQDKGSAGRAGGSGGKAQSSPLLVLLDVCWGHQTGCGGLAPTHLEG